MSENTEVTDEKVTRATNSQGRLKVHVVQVVLLIIGALGLLAGVFMRWYAIQQDILDPTLWEHYGWAFVLGGGVVISALGVSKRIKCLLWGLPYSRYRDIA